MWRRADKRKLRINHSATETDLCSFLHTLSSFVCTDRASRWDWNRNDAEGDFFFTSEEAEDTKQVSRRWKEKVSLIKREKEINKKKKKKKRDKTSERIQILSSLLQKIRKNFSLTNEPLKLKKIATYFIWWMNNETFQ